MRGARGDAIAVMAAGLAAVAASWWFSYRAVLVVGVAVTVFGTVTLGMVLSRGRAWHEQNVLIGVLWVLVKRFPSGCALADPVTGEFLSAQRERGWLTLAVSDTPGMGAQTVVASYLVGRWGVPAPPPLCKHLASVVDAPPASWPWRQRAQVADFNAKTGALELAPEELAALHAQVRRTLAVAAPPSRWLPGQGRTHGTCG
jgi:hypothetical protein